jgi:hypothetical protein
MGRDLISTRFIHGLLLVAGVTSLASRVSAVGTGGVDRAAFNTLPDAGRVDVVLAALDARERALANYSCKVKQRTETIDGGGKSIGAYVTDYEFRRRDDRSWLHTTDHDFKDSPVVISESVDAWDGAVGKLVVYPPSVGTRYAQCGISATEGARFRQCSY